MLSSGIKYLKSKYIRSKYTRIILLELSDNINILENILEVNMWFTQITFNIKYPVFHTHISKHNVLLFGTNVLDFYYKFITYDFISVF